MVPSAFDFLNGLRKIFCSGSIISQYIFWVIDYYFKMSMWFFPQGSHILTCFSFLNKFIGEKISTFWFFFHCLSQLKPLLSVFEGTLNPHCISSAISTVYEMLYQKNINLVMLLQRSKFSFLILYVLLDFWIPWEPQKRDMLEYV